ncbi:MAG: sigma-70 family RNA polymerase sigma factor [Bacilli bacterium]|nr:sigma-70 family RNA polymerase sigma factor [Bacilli bacterium]
MRSRPKRRKHKDNPYTLLIDDNTYKVTFLDSKNNIQVIEVDADVFDALDCFELDDLSQLNEYDRHIDRFDIDETSYKKYSNKPQTLEEEILQNMLYNELKLEISRLPEVQRRRLVLYFFNELTLQEIAIIDNCSPQAVKKSLDSSIEKLSMLFQ